MNFSTASRLILASLIPLFGLSVALAQPVTWQEAVTDLVSERSNAERCVSILKKNGDSSSLKAGENAYTIGKAKMDAVLTALDNNLKDEKSVRLEDLKLLLSKVVDARISVCNNAAKSISSGNTGEKNLILNFMKNTIVPLVMGAKSIMGVEAKEALRRRTIRTQLEAARWPTYSSIRPSS